MQEEVWKRAQDFPDYEVSNYGRVKSYKRDKINGRLMKLIKNNGGYFSVNLTDKTGSPFTFGIHRLVAETFIPNLDGKPQVNHIDENKMNNHVSNLEWVTCKENINHGTHNERSAKSRNKKVRCVETGEIYQSLKEATHQTKIGNIGSVCRGERQTAGGFQWEYVG